MAKKEKENKKVLRKSGGDESSLIIEGLAQSSIATTTITCKHVENQLLVKILRQHLYYHLPSQIEQHLAITFLLF